MNPILTAAGASALALAAGLAALSPAPVRAQSADAAQPAGGADMAEAEAALNFLQRLSATYLVLFARSAVDFTYDSLTIDTTGNETVINGLVVSPRLDWDAEGACRISVDRVAATGAPDLERIETVIEMSGIALPAACFEPGLGAMMSSFGYATVAVDRAAATIAYHVPSSAAEMLVSADVADAADITVTAEFDYVWITGLLEEEGEPEPVAKLRTAEVVIENDGIWERVSPLLEGQFGDLEQIPNMVGPMLGQALAQPGQAMGAAEQRFIENVSAELGRFVRDGDRLVLTMAPEGGVWLDEEVFETPGTAIAALEPSVSAAPMAIRGMLAPETLSAALAGGQALGPDARLEAGRALITGVGAPRARAEAVALLEPLAGGWNAEAASLLAGALAEAGDTLRAYEMALRAMAGEVPGAIGRADAIEARLGAEAVLAAQTQTRAAWPGAGGFDRAVSEAESGGNVGELRRLAFDASAGRAMPRSYRDAYYLASLAAAAGDTGAAALRDRLDRSFTGLDGGLAPAWAETRDAAARAALEAWTGGIATAVRARYGLE